MELNPQIFETIMLVCFGSSWPFAILKTLKTRNVQGKSLFFLCCIFTGYLSGISFKLTGNYDNVIWLYVFNGIMIFIEISLYFRFSSQNESPAFNN